ncbi:MAG: exodeoxyribonuclease III [Candidatus Heimdallarchaeota archaeon]|nr:MAG: exodeoxyribonuclease III [Candidatus Heimdallarchaeota archaeon]
MELLSWNVNGIRACIKKGFIEWVKQRDPEILCLQETKAQADQISFSFDLPDYRIYWSSAKKKGYSGVATLTKIKPVSVLQGLGVKEFDIEGRFLQLEFEDFFLINLYFPNAQRELKRLDYKLRFNQTLLAYLNKIKEKNKGIILCGDFNVAHKEIDLKNPKTNQNNAGFSPQERAFFTELLEHGYIDTFREFDQSPEQYTWWTYRYNARTRNIGWRIDYFLIDLEFRERLESAFILNEVMGSDHVPVGIIISVE